MKCRAPKFKMLPTSLEFFPRYGSASQRFAVVMGKCWQFIAIFIYEDKNLREAEFCSTNDTKHSLFTILVENFALSMGLHFKMLPWLWHGS